MGVQEGEEVQNKSIDKIVNKIIAENVHNHEGKRVITGGFHNIN
jgi:hypothetical protein